MLKRIDHNYKGKELGHGMNGTVYDYGKYALKVTHILDPKDVKLKQEIKFAKVMGDKYPNQFLHLYDWDVIDDCKMKQKYAIENVMQMKLGDY